ncbi:hypothetical protein HDV57DRAFT_517629 [Trichoderma longibrachiatum]|uniref:Uncharacterized protein n=1 Tax=Trichoderma longibrachiatum ATCC 18648 TaxID=983965 RepID=A0A2T4BUW8_TRILO|nr:hypothetical protein M440DRAFT_1404819 [Trichoderma longibrachiatum ATCC 18648]
MGQFDWFKKIGATDEAVAVLNDQPYLFTVLVVVLVVLFAEGGFLYFIHWATFKPSQRKKKPDAAKGGKPGAGASTGAAAGGGLLGRLRAGAGSDNSRRAPGGN